MVEPACRTDPWRKKEAPVPPGEALDQKIKQIAQTLASQSRQELDDEQAVAVSTFVNLNNLYKTSALGRHLGEKLLSELQQAGLVVVEVRKTPALMMSQHHGEYGLSRDMDEIGLTQPVQALVTGTYTVADREIFVSARIVRNRDNRILSTADLVLPIDPLTKNLLADESMPASNHLSPVNIRPFPEETAPAKTPVVVSKTAVKAKKVKISKIKISKVKVRKKKCA